MAGHGWELNNRLDEKSVLALPSLVYTNVKQDRAEQTGHVLREMM